MVDPKVKEAFGRVKEDMERLNSKFEKINQVLKEILGYIEVSKHPSKSLDESKQASKQPSKHLNTSNKEHIDTEHKEVSTHLNTSKTYTSKHLDSSTHLNSSISMDSLTYAEKDIVRVLYNHSGMNLTYKDIAEVLKKNHSTIRNQICRLKKITNILEESTDSDGNKRYALKENLKLKQMIISDQQK